MPQIDCFQQLDHNGRSYGYYSLQSAADALGINGLAQIPYSLRVILENMLRHQHEEGNSPDRIKAVFQGKGETYPYRPARVLLQDLLGIPLLIDFAAMRDTAKQGGIDPATVNPSIPVDFIIDHSLKVVHAGSAEARQQNEDIQFAQNDERFRFLRWCQQAFENLTVYPPDCGIMHQINIEHLARVVWLDETDNGPVLYPDTMIGTDSHTPMVNALGVVGWGVGGLDAEGAMLGLPLVYPVPDVIGIRLEGELREGVTATDLVLTITERLRAFGVVGKFVEFFGPGLNHLSLADRATISNMAPEYGATCVYFPVDQRTIDYLRMTGRDENHVELVEAYLRAQGLWRDDKNPAPVYASKITLDLGDVAPCIAGPRRPQDRVDLGKAPEAFHDIAQSYFGRPLTALKNRHTVQDRDHDLGDGDVVIAAITSCTNTSNPASLIAAGLLAKKAIAKGLQTKPWVKTSLAPGSKVVADYLQSANLQTPLDLLGFQIAGFGCTTCGGMSGPLADEIRDTIEANDLVASAVLSGNRNFEGRIHPHCRASYLASPPLVVAYALAGSLRCDLTTDSLGTDPEGNSVYLTDIWPTSNEINEAVRQHLKPEMFQRRYANILDGSEAWQALDGGNGLTFPWDEHSTYIRRPPYFDNTATAGNTGVEMAGLRPLVILGSSITTDHISPSSAILPDSAAGEYLMDRQTRENDFNSYGTRRGNFEVVARASFANIRLKNHMMGGQDGSFTKVMPEGETQRVFDAAEIYKQRDVGTIVIAGAEYGCGSSRDTAAKGPWLLGIRAVVAESFERIHRSNLVAMGILPLQFEEGTTTESLGLDGSETYALSADDMEPGVHMNANLTIHREEPPNTVIPVCVRLDTEEEVHHYRHGGILPRIYRRVAGDNL